MKKTIQYIYNSVKFFVVLTILFSIVANGAFAGQRIENAEKVNSEKIEIAQLQQGPASPDELPLNMEKSTQPDTEQPALLKAVQIAKTDNSQSRFKLYKQQSNQILKEFLNSHNHKIIVATTSQVHSKLGRQFTLVGAKPSGTS